MSWDEAIEKSVVSSKDLVEGRVSEAERKPPPSKPEGATEREWAYACERAERARAYAAKFPQMIRPSEVCFQDPGWQWEKEASGRVAM
jgi:hypothetical protein